VVFAGRICGDEAPGIAPALTRSDVDIAADLKDQVHLPWPGGTRMESDGIPGNYRFKNHFERDPGLTGWLWSRRQQLIPCLKNAVVFQFVNEKSCLPTLLISKDFCGKSIG
jgi:hypothetical protein